MRAVLAPPQTRQFSFAELLSDPRTPSLFDIPQFKETIMPELSANSHPVPLAAMPRGDTVITPIDVLNRAVAQGAGVEVLEKLMALQERWEANQARKAFNEAIALAKAEIPVIIKNRHVGFDSKKPGAPRTDYRHEDLGEIARTVDPILSRHGLSYRWRTTSVPNDPITVTCVVSHHDGHSEQNTLSAGRDETGNKNSIQAIGSTITYLQRYSLKAALGLAAANDDDGRAAGRAGEFVTAQQAADLEKLLNDTGGNIERFCKFAGVGKLGDIHAGRFEDAKAAIMRAAEHRRAKS